jgi:hypothetical protein
LPGLPDYVFEWIGRTVAERLDLLTAEYRTEIAELRSTIIEKSAELDRLKATGERVERLLMRKVDHALDVVDARLSEIKDGKDGRDGIDGKDGAPGDKGEKGDAGDRGEKGDPGADGVVRIHKSNWEGVWEEGKEYEAGCLVSHRGSGWHCNADGTKERPGEGSKDWTLAIKCGRDGRPGKDGKDGSPGPQGKPGPKGDRGYDA